MIRGPGVSLHYEGNGEWKISNVCELTLLTGSRRLPYSRF